MIRRKVQERYQELSEQIVDQETYSKHLSKEALTERTDRWPMKNPHWQFECRKVIRSAHSLVHHISASFSDSPESAVINNAPDGDIEVCYDFGEQRCGYFEFTAIAAAGTVIDLFSVEHIDRIQGIQHTWGNRNGVRYIFREGENTFFSTKRRSGRYLFLILRNQHPLL